MKVSLSAVALGLVSAPGVVAWGSTSSNATLAYPYLSCADGEVQVWGTSRRPTSRAGSSPTRPKRTSRSSCAATKTITSPKLPHGPIPSDTPNGVASPRRSTSSTPTITRPCRATSTSSATARGRAASSAPCPTIRNRRLTTRCPPGAVLRPPSSSSTSSATCISRSTTRTFLGAEMASMSSGMARSSTCTTYGTPPSPRSGSAACEGSRILSPRNGRTSWLLRLPTASLRLRRRVG